LTTFLSNNEATSISTQRSVTSAVVVSIEIVDNQDEKSRKDKQLAEQIVLDGVKQREKRKAEDEAATALFFRLEAEDARRSLEIQEAADQQAIQDILAADGVQQQQIQENIADQSATSDRQSQRLAITGLNGSDQAGPSTARSTTCRSEKAKQPESAEAMKTRMLLSIEKAVKADTQMAQLQAINAAEALKDDSVADEDNPLYCYVCTNFAAKEKDMKGYACRDRRHFICRECWYKVSFCPHCGKTQGRY